MPNRIAPALFVLFALFALACTGQLSPLRRVDLDHHGSIAQEWAPHDGLLEWWYLTGRVTDAERAQARLSQRPIDTFRRTKPSRVATLRQDT